MTVKTKTKSLDQLLTIAKPFVGSLRGKTASRPVLKTALVTEKHIIVTDTHILLRMEHKKEFPMSELPFLHHYNEEMSQNCEAKRYPDVSRIIPSQDVAKLHIDINIDEWIKAHENALPAAKEHTNNLITLNNKTLIVKPLLRKAVKGSKSNYSSIKRCKGYKDVEVPIEEQKTFERVLNQDTGIEEVLYNCEYMIMMLKAFKKLGHKEATLHFYDRLRPMLLTADGIEGLLLPIRKY